MKPEKYKNMKNKPDLSFERQNQRFVDKTSKKYPRHKWLKYQQKSSESRYSYARIWSSPMASAITNPYNYMVIYIFRLRSCSKVSFVSIFVCIRHCMPKTDNPEHSPSLEWFPSQSERIRRTGRLCFRLKPTACGFLLVMFRMAYFHTCSRLYSTK